jgi:hypothetical protein
MRSSRSRGWRALSLRGAFWQLRDLVLGAGAALALTAAPALAAPGGDIATLPIGDYICETPGDAAGPAGRHAPAEDFAVVTASSYRALGTLGSYLLTGDQLVMTSGVHRGKRYHRVSTGFLRKIGPDGKDSALRCVRRKRNNS